MISRKKNNRKKIIGSAVVLAVALLSSAFFFHDFLMKKISRQASKQEQRYATLGDTGQSYPVPDLIEVNGQMKKISVDDGVADATSEENQDFSAFSGLPKFGDFGNESVQQELALFSQDKEEVIIQVAVYDLESARKSDETEPIILRQEEYRCGVAQKKCESSQLLSQQYRGIEGANQIWWSKWDSKKQMLYGNVVGNDGQSILPIYICDTKEKTCDSIRTGKNSNNVPNGFASPSLNKFIVIEQNDKVNEETGSKWELLLYGNGDPSSPIHNYDISGAITRDEEVTYDSVGSLAWDSKEENIFFITSSKIFSFNFQKGELNLLYASPMDSEDNQAYLDSSNIFLSSDSRYVFFIESQEIFIDEEESEMKDVLKKIDLAQNNEVMDAL